MKIIDENGEAFDLPPNFELNITETNPFLTEQGSVSLPIELPNTSRNQRILGFPDRPERVKKFKKKRKTYIQNNSFVKDAIMNTFDVDDMISSYFQLNESTIYARLKEITMPELFKNVVRDPYSGPVENKVSSWVNHLTKVMIGEATDDFHIFPVCTRIYQKTITQQRPERDITFTVYEFINAPATVSNGDDEAMTAVDSNGKEYFLLRGSKEWSVKDEDDVEIKYPAGYGITPFLKYSVVLRKVFEYFGYTLTESLFDTDSDLKDVVMPNNTADALLNGVLDYSQLVPTCLVNEFLDSVRADFGCEFFITESKKTVDIRFFNDMIDSVPDMDLTHKITSKPKHGFSDPQQIKLKANRSLEYTETNFNSYQELINNFGEPIFQEYYPYVFNQSTPRPTPGFYFFANRNAFYEVKSEYEVNLIAYNVFDYYEKEDDEIAYKEYTTKREHLACISADLVKVHPVYTTRASYRMTVPFIGERRHLNTVLRLKTETENEVKIEEVTEKSEDQDKCPLMACFYAGRGVLREDDNYRYLWLTMLVYGTTSCYNNIGEMRGKLSLSFQGEYGLYKRFWERWNDILLNSFQKITFSAELMPHEIMNYRMYRTKMFNGQKLLTASIKYTSKEDSIKVEEMELYTIKLYE